MNDILVLKNTLQGLKTTFKNKRRYIWVFLVSFLIGWAILLIFWPSQKPARAEEIATSTNFGGLMGKGDNFEIACTTATQEKLNCQDYSCTLIWGFPYYSNCSKPYEVFNLTTTTQTITTATLRFFGGYLSNAYTNAKGDFNVVSFSPTDPMAITTGDFQNFGTTTFSDYQTEYATWAGTYFYDFVFNANGLAYLNSKKGGYASLGVRVKTDIEATYDWGGSPYTSFAGSNIPKSTLIFNSIPPVPTLEITSPPDGSAQTTNFDIEANYNLLAEDYDRTMIIFEDWDASSTCPIYGTQEYTDEMALGYFNNQSQPYFSDFFATSTGTTSIAVGDLAKGNYRCVRCYFINETTATISAELCNGYGIEIPNTLPPTIPTYYTGQNWATFYTEHGDKWATSTELFTYLAGKTAPLLLWVGNFTADFKNLFNNASSSAMGQQLGSAIPQARGYLTIINYYFAGIPIGEVFIFYLLTALILIVLKVVLMIWHFFRG